jgi:hypothetical protein
MFSSRGWRLAVASCFVFVSLGCSDPATSSGGAGGTGATGGLGGAGGNCPDSDAANACLDLQNCCRAILVNPVFFEACNSLVFLCDEQKCTDALAGYPYPECVPEPPPDGGVGGGGGSADAQ